jgi:hypothetical protein
MCARTIYKDAYTIINIVIAPANHVFSRTSKLRSFRDRPTCPAPCGDVATSETTGARHAASVAAAVTRPVEPPSEHVLWSRAS